MEAPGAISSILRPVTVMPQMVFGNFPGLRWSGTFSRPSEKSVVPAHQSLVWQLLKSQLPFTHHRLHCDARNLDGCITGGRFEQAIDQR